MWITPLASTPCTSVHSDHMLCTLHHYLILLYTHLKNNPCTKPEFYNNHLLQKSKQIHRVLLTPGNTNMPAQKGIWSTHVCMYSLACPPRWPKWYHLNKTATMWFQRDKCFTITGYLTPTSGTLLVSTYNKRFPPNTRDDTNHKIVTDCMFHASLLDLSICTLLNKSTILMTADSTLWRI